MNHEILKITDLPSIDDLVKSSQSLALLDAILMPDWQGRYFSFNRHWNQSGNEMMASMRNGSGSEYFVLFTECGAVGKVFDDEAGNAGEKMLARVPDSFVAFKDEPAFQVDSATFFFWHLKDDHSDWEASPNTLSGYAYLNFLVAGSDHYHAWAESYYERVIDKRTVREVFDNRNVTEKQLLTLNPDLVIADLRGDVEEIVVR
jgi:hypothetical protein